MIKNNDLFDYLEKHFIDNKGFDLINISAVSRMFNVNTKTVRGYIDLIMNDGDLVKEEDAQQETSKLKYAILQGYTDELDKMLADSNIKYMAAFKRLQKMGFTGSYSTIKSYGKEFARGARAPIPELRSVHLPGDNLQFDWKESLSMESAYGEIFEFNILVCRFHYCDSVHATITIDRTQRSLYRALDNAFTTFEGVPNCLLTDNMKTVVDEARKGKSKAIINAKFKQFASDYGFKIKTCKPFRAKTKGTVENGVYLVFNRLLAYNKSFTDLADLQRIVTQICDQYNSDINQATRQTPNALFELEKEHLHPLPGDKIRDFYTSSRVLSTVTTESAVVYGGCKYSVPPSYIGKKLEVDIENNNLLIYDSINLIRIHPIKVVSDDKRFDFRTPMYHADDLLTICKLGPYKGFSDKQVKQIMYNNYFLTGYIDGGGEMFEHINDNKIDDEYNSLDAYDFL